MYTCRQLDGDTYVQRPLLLNIFTPLKLSAAHYYSYYFTLAILQYYYSTRSVHTAAMRVASAIHTCVCMYVYANMVSPLIVGGCACLQLGVAGHGADSAAAKAAYDGGDEDEEQAGCKQAHHQPRHLTYTPV